MYWTPNHESIWISKHFSLSYNFMKPDFDPNNCSQELQSTLTIENSVISTVLDGITWVYKDNEWFQRIESKTAVYIENIPTDTKVEELQDYFKKCGIIMLNDDDTPKIKLFGKNDATITFFKPASVDIAIKIYDETPLRHGSAPMKISRATFLDYGTNKQQKNNKSKRSQKQPTITKRQKLEKKLEWFDLEESQKHKKTVILRHMFRPEELVADPKLLIEIKDDVQHEAEKVGHVTKVILYDLHPDGVVCVKYSNALGAQACVELMNDRIFDGLQVKATIYDGKERFNDFRSKEDVIDSFGKHLEEEEDDEDE